MTALAFALAMPAFTLDASAESDSRTVVTLSPDDHAHLLEQMRDFLVYSTATLGALAERDMAEVRRLAERVRPPLERARSLAEGAAQPPMSMPVGGSHRVDPARFGRMRRDLPASFRAMLLQMREGIAEIARDASAVGDPMHAVEQLRQVQEVCVACHNTYRLASDPNQE